MFRHGAEMVEMPFHLPLCRCLHSRIRRRMSGLTQRDRNWFIPPPSLEPKYVDPFQTNNTWLSKEAIFLSHVYV